MWNDVVIGKGDKGCSAVKVFAISGDHSISHNSVSFWVTNCILKTGLTIFKDTPEGQELQFMIENGVPLNEIQDWLDGIVLKNIELENFKQKILQSNKESFEKGKQFKMAEIRTTLGLNFGEQR